ncbi:MAG TPA: hypothetical protein VLD67_07045, partial [Vicinamibacterales bacterium]|nr:hypothetical protein [Vicinamibacterales bacterium]
MLPATVNAPGAEPAGSPSAQEWFDAYVAHLAATGRGNHAYDYAARVFLRRWPDPHRWAMEPLAVRLSLPSSATALVMFLITRHGLRPGWD